MKSFAERNLTVLGAVGVVSAVVVTGAALQYDKLPVFNSGEKYSAHFVEAAGLKAGDGVRAAGVRVGKVDSITLDGTEVLVSFTVTGDVPLGQQTTAAIKTETVLGTRALELTPKGDGALDTDTAIPSGRTSVPYELTATLGELATNIDSTDEQKLSESLTTIAAGLKDAPPEIGAALDGVTRLSESISTRDTMLQNLFANAEGSTGVLADRADQLNRLILDGNVLLDALTQRQAQIDVLLTAVSNVATQIQGVVDDNRAQIGPVLSDLNAVLEILDRHRKDLQDSLVGLSSYIGNLGESFASGPFFNTYLQNLLPGFLVEPAIRARYPKEFADALGGAPAAPLDPRLDPSPPMPTPFATTTDPPPPLPSNTAAAVPAPPAPAPVVIPTTATPPTTPAAPSSSVNGGQR